MLTAPDLIQAAGQATRRLNEREAEARGSSLAAEAEAREIAAALEALEAKKRWDDPAIYDRDALVIDCGSCLSRGGMSSAARPAAVVRTQACKLDDMTRNGVQPWHGGDEVDRLRKKLWDQTRTASKCTDAALDLRVPLRVGDGAAPPPLDGRAELSGGSAAPLRAAPVSLGWAVFPDAKAAACKRDSLGA